MTDLDVSESARRRSFAESSSNGGIGAGILSLIIPFAGLFDGGGSNDADSVDEFARQLSQHAESSSRHMETATRSLSSTSIGEVQQRAHSQGESDDHFESRFSRDVSASSLSTRFD